MNVFSKFDDYDFYSDKVNHIYLYDDINDNTVLYIKEEIKKYNTTLIDNNGIKYASKPIVIHINSLGGNLNSGVSLKNSIKKSSIPIAILIEGISASASTFLSIYADYRIMTEFSVSLIHEYSANIPDMIKKEAAEFIIKQLNLTQDNINKMYLKKTNLTKNQLNDLLKRDLFLPSTFCLKYNIIDRIIKPRRNNFKLLSTNILMKKTNFNIINMICVEGNFNNIISTLNNVLYDNIKPIVFHINNYNCSYDIFLLLNKIMFLNIPTYSLLENSIYLNEYIPFLYTNKKIMYDDIFITIDFTNFLIKENKLKDTIENTKLFINFFKYILREKTKIPELIIDNIDKNKYILTAKECKKYKLVDEIIKSL